jgi:anti-sigma factor RsiW
MKKKRIKVKECKRVRGLLPLLVGGDLPESKAAALRTHLEGCAACQREYEVHLFAHRQAKAWLGKERRDWHEADWRRTVHGAVNQAVPRGSLTVIRPFVRKTWAYAAGLLAVVMLGIFLLQPQLGRKQAKIKPGITAGPETGQEVVAVTIVSPKSGLKINWFLNKNFEWEDIK